MTRHSGAHQQVQPVSQVSQGYHTPQVAQVAQAPRNTWSTFIARALPPLLTILLGLVAWLGAERVKVFEQKDAELSTKTEALDRRQGDTERTLAAMQAADAERTRLVLSGLERIEKKIDRHMDRGK